MLGGFSLALELSFDTGGLDVARFLEDPRVSPDKLTWKLERLEWDGDEELSGVEVELEVEGGLGFLASREPAVKLLRLVVGSVVGVGVVESVVGGEAAALTNLLRKLGAIYSRPQLLMYTRSNGLLEFEYNEEKLDGYGGVI